MDEDKVANRSGADTDRDPQAQTNVRVESRGCVVVVTLDRPRVRNAVDSPIAAKLATAVRDFDPMTRPGSGQTGSGNARRIVVTALRRIVAILRSPVPVGHRRWLDCLLKI